MTYLNKKDIQTLLGIPYKQASRIYQHAMDLDHEKLKYQIYDTKVRMQSVLAVSGISLNMLKKQIEPEKKSAAASETNALSGK